MTPKEKAMELIDKYIKLYPSYVVMWQRDVDNAKKNIKECALIAVDEILKLDLHDVGDYRNDQSSLDNFSTVTWYINYWEEVKHEIEKL